MIRKPKLTSVQLMMITVGSALMFPYTFMPLLNTPPANQDVWIVLILSFLYIVPMSTPVLILINKCRGFSLNELTETVLGKFLGKVASLFFVFLFLFCFCACMLIAAIFVSISIVPATPAWAFLFYSLIPISYAAYKGAGTIGRLATFIVPFIMLTIAIFFLMGLELMDIKVLQPVLKDSTLLELNEGAFFTGARYSEILIFLVFSFFLNQKESINKTYIKALCVFAVFHALILIPTLLVLGIDFAKNEFNPYFVYTRQVHLYDFIQRVQALNTLAWYPGLLLKLSLYNFMGSYVLSGVFKTKSHKGFVVPISILGFIFCMIPALNKSDVILYLASDKFFPYMILPITFILPLLLLTVYLIRRKKIDIIVAQKRMQTALSESKVFQMPENSGTDQMPDS